MNHGSEYAYKLGCRCRLCRNASAAARARRRRGEGPGIAVGLQIHGLNGYKDHGCRCDVCTKANRLRMRAYRARRRLLEAEHA